MNINVTKLLIILFSFTVFSLMGQKYNQGIENSSENPNEAISKLNEGLLIIRLNSGEKAIKHLESIGNYKAAEKRKKKKRKENLKIYTAFKNYYNFSDVVCTYGHLLKKNMEPGYKLSILNDSIALDEKIEIPHNYYILNTSNPGGTFNEYHIQDRQFNNLAKPFPFIYDRGLFAQNTATTIKVINGKTVIDTLMTPWDLKAKNINEKLTVYFALASEVIDIDYNDYNEYRNRESSGLTLLGNGIVGYVARGNYGENQLEFIPAISLGAKNFNNFEISEPYITASATVGYNFFIDSKIKEKKLRLKNKYIGFKLGVADHKNTLLSFGVTYRMERFELGNSSSSKGFDIGLNKYFALGNVEPESLSSYLSESTISLFLRFDFNWFKN